MAVCGRLGALVEPVGIDHRVGDRKQRRALVMVDHDDIEPRGACFLERLERLCPAIDTDRDACPLGLELDQGFARRAVALHQPVGDVDHRVGAEPPQQQHQQSRACCPVDVVIAEDRDGFARLNRVGEAFRAFLHVLEAARIGQEIADAGIAVPGEVVASDSPRKQQLVDQCVHPKPRLTRTAPAPRLSTHGRADAECKLGNGLG